MAAKHLRLLCQATDGSTSGMAILIDVEDENTAGQDQDRTITILLEKCTQLERQQEERKKKIEEVHKRNEEMEDILSQRRNAIHREHETKSKVEAFETELKSSEYSLETAKLKLKYLEEEISRKTDLRDAEEKRYRAAIDNHQYRLERDKTELERETTENTLLVHLLKVEADKWKSQAQQLEMKADVQMREDAKNTILLGILNTQLFTGRADAVTRRAEVDFYRKEVKHLESELGLAQEKLSELQRLDRSLLSTLDEKETDHHYAIVKRQTQLQRSELVKDALETELNDALVQMKQFQQKSQSQATTAGGQNSFLEEQIRICQEGTSNITTALKEMRQLAMTGSQRREDERTKINIKMETLGTVVAASEMKTFESLTKQASESELLLRKIEIQRKALEELDDRTFVRESEIKDMISATKQQTTALVNASKECEAESSQAIAKLAASNECLRQKIEQLQQALIERNDIHIAERIAVSHKCQINKKNVEKCENKIEDAAQVHKEKVTQLQHELSAVSECRTTSDAVALQIRQLKDDFEFKAYQKEIAERRVTALGIENSKRVRIQHDREVAFGSESKSLKTEIRGHQRTVLNLEAKVAETHKFREKAEENETLAGLLKDLKTELRHKQNVISTMKVEKGMLDGYKCKVLTEQNEAQQRKLQTLERAQIQLAPLLTELIETARKHEISINTVTAAEGVLLRIKKTTHQGNQLIHPLQSANSIK